VKRKNKHKKPMGRQTICIAYFAASFIFFVLFARVVHEKRCAYYNFFCALVAVSHPHPLRSAHCAQWVKWLNAISL